MSEENIRYTDNMEKALQQAHGIGHEAYKNDLDKKIQIEQDREKDYQKSLEVEQELAKKISR
ncbi:hypothetical protein CR194_19370 [Salipaludibacillus keqinensis]|uniref:Small, acid-soluble spore protein tlp n=1 Tax=Salipaludibacillus keqinensis TaxID=2045207 RepID=A0A323T655_9BACI|nr:hypothetical protein [Salipaludibacillus keqinensis]PYZ91778.1 hypothetical protein CR194_19370 [Salipaludibacillus keqinensis]